mgnify:CR=1 FL=1
MNAEDKYKGHYQSLPIQPIEYILANNLDFCSGNIIKYATRWDKKGDPVGDLTKIIDYAKILLAEQWFRLSLSITKITFADRIPCKFDSKRELWNWMKAHGFEEFTLEFIKHFGKPESVEVYKGSVVDPYVENNLQG